MTHTDTAASELIAVMALIAIFVTAAAVVAVMVLSNPPGDAAPAMLAHVEEEDGNVYLYHDGGDPLQKEHFTVLVDGVPWTNATLVGTSGNDWTTWGTGQALVLSGVSPAAEIRIVADGVDRRGGSWLIFEDGTAATPTTTTIVPTTTITTVPTTTTIVPTTTVTTIPTTEPTPAPVDADFTADPTAGDAPLTVQFTDMSTGGPTAWLWDFGDGGRSTEKNPEHTYGKKGTYAVSLTASRPGESDTETKTDYITVTNPNTRISSLHVKAITNVSSIISVATPVEIPYNGDLRGSEVTEYTITRTSHKNQDAGFTVTLTAPDQITTTFNPGRYDFDHWEVNDIRYDSPAVTISVPNDKTLKATAYYD